MAGKFSIYKYVRLEGKGWRYARAAYHTNGKIKPNVVLVKGVNGSATEEKHTEGSYFLNFNNTWIPVGADALEAQYRRKVKLNQVEHERLSGKTAAPGPNLVQLGRKVIKEEVDAYLANLELAKRPYKTVGEKRRFLTSFLRIVPKKFVDEFSRNDVLTFRNELMVDYDPEYVGKQMMAVVTFFNQWLRLKLNIQKYDWPEHEQNPPEPYIDAEIVALETHTKGKTNLMVRLFRSTGCRDMEVAHLTDTDISPRTKEILIRQKPCFHCKECISRGNIWKPKTPASTRSIPVSDGLLAELLALPKGLLFPNESRVSVRLRTGANELGGPRAPSTRQGCGPTRRDWAIVVGSDSRSGVGAQGEATPQRWNGNRQVQASGRA